MDESAYYFSPSQKAFYASGLKDTYQKIGNWPDDLVPVDDDVFQLYGLSPPPDGMTRGATKDGCPCWIDVNELPEVRAARLARRGVHVHGSNIDAYFSPDLATGLTTIIMDIKMGFPLPEPGTHRLPDSDGGWHEFTAEQLQVLYPALRRIQALIERGSQLKDPEIEIP